MRAFFVIGPESSGTRLMTRLLIAADCQGDDGHEQRWDREAPKGEMIVWRRSFPHGGEWPKIEELAGSLIGQGYQVMFLVMSRDWHAMSDSQIQAGHVPGMETALKHIRDAYSRIFAFLTITGYPFEIVNYETLIRPGGEAVFCLMNRLELTIGRSVDIYDGNAKYYKYVRT